MYPINKLQESKFVWEILIKKLNIKNIRLDIHDFLLTKHVVTEIYLLFPQISDYFKQDLIGKLHMFNQIVLNSTHCLEHKDLIKAGVKIVDISWFGLHEASQIQVLIFQVMEKYLFTSVIKESGMWFTLMCFDLFCKPSGYTCELERINKERPSPVSQKW